MKRNKYAENKFQLLKCPWCDEVLTRENKKYEESEGIGYHIPGEVERVNLFLGVQIRDATIQKNYQFK